MEEVEEVEVVVKEVEEVEDKEEEVEEDLDNVLLSSSADNIFRKMRLTAITAASLVKATKSAPTNPGVDLAIKSISKSPSNVNLLHSTINIRARAFLSGTDIHISRSNLPARLSAGSNESGRFVAPMTMTACPPVFSMVRLSKHVNSCATILLSMPREAVSLLGVIASISSINTKQGALAIASSNKDLTFCSDCPDIPETISGALTRKNATPNSPAMALANDVLPHPGGPCNNIPRGGSTPKCA